MKAIETRFVGPSNTKGSRYVATDGDFRVIVGAQDANIYEKNHELAAITLIRKHWAPMFAECIDAGRMKLISGGTRKGYVFLLVDGY